MDNWTPRDNRQYNRHVVSMGIAHWIAWLAILVFGMYLLYVVVDGINLREIATLLP